MKILKNEDVNIAKGVKGAKIINEPKNPPRKTRHFLVLLFNINPVKKSKRLSNKKLSIQIISKYTVNREYPLLLILSWIG